MPTKKKDYADSAMLAERPDFGEFPERYDRNEGAVT
jgi:hypothetical protein